MGNSIHGGFVHLSDFGRLNKRAVLTLNFRLALAPLSLHSGEVRHAR